MRIGLIGDSLTEGRPGVSFLNLLKERYPNLTFDNLGKPGETVKSLHARLTKSKLATDYDLAFLWIGTNDVYSKMLSVQAQPVAGDRQEFREVFTKVLEIVIASAKQVVTVSPAIIGENMSNEANKELRDLSTIIQSITDLYSTVSFLNMQAVFEGHLANVKSSDYMSTSVWRVMKDVLFYKNEARIDRLSNKRGLHLTLDGIHLNTSGARIVADEYTTVMEYLIYNNSRTLEK
ncbi:GDSL-type esterase/lipase family protein [Bacillus sp. PK3_68]|uniref:SGNH/GDSL hydrolase family protein n=1 Tax=Bacillus sp. PK3_68 TaxID=2027408 RepID=UPI000E751BE1|nr:GDSL-type esterase/lipase family protein [Bacillus sp. PK3_68]RJS58816.1 GDSL family lipase [Bacillus sp. PK3_68]